MRFSFSHTFIRKASAAALLAALAVSASAPAQAFPLRSAPASVAAVDVEPMQPLAYLDFGAIAPTLDELKAQKQAESAEELAFVPHVWPVRFSGSGRITSYFGYRLNPTAGSGSEFHGGVDMADKLNSKIYAAGSGTVVEAGENGGYGLTILIDHGNGYQSRYCHCSSLLVSKGDFVGQGDIIAAMGQTGRATGVHLDFRVYLDGAAVDPLGVLDPLNG